MEIALADGQIFLPAHARGIRTMQNMQSARFTPRTVADAGARLQVTTALSRLRPIDIERIADDPPEPRVHQVSAHIAIASRGS